MSLDYLKIVRYIKDGKTDEALALLRRFDRKQIDKFHCSHTLLHQACIHSDRPVLELILQMGPQVDLKSNLDKMTGVHYAAENGSIQCMDLLLKHGASVHAEDAKGFTPLHKAAKHGHLSCVMTLVNRGADVTNVPKKGSIIPELTKTAYDLARENGHAEIANYLQQVSGGSTFSHQPGGHMYGGNNFSPQLTAGNSFTQQPVMNTPPFTGGYSNNGQFVPTGCNNIQGQPGPVDSNYQFPAGCVHYGASVASSVPPSKPHGATGHVHVMQQMPGGHIDSRATSSPIHGIGKPDVQRSQTPVGHVNLNIGMNHESQMGFPGGMMHFPSAPSFPGFPQISMTSTYSDSNVSESWSTNKNI